MLSSQTRMNTYLQELETHRQFLPNPGHLTGSWHQEQLGGVLGHLLLFEQSSNRLSNHQGGLKGIQQSPLCLYY